MAVRVPTTVPLSGHGHDGGTEAGDDEKRAAHHCAEFLVFAFAFAVDTDVVDGAVAVVDEVAWSLS